MTSPSFETTLLKFNSPTAEFRTSGRASSRAVLEGMKKRIRKIRKRMIRRERKELG